MATLLHVVAHPQPETSQTTQLSQAFLEAYHEVHPDDVIEELHLYQIAVPYLTAAHLEAMKKRDTPEMLSPEEAAAWTDITGLLRQFCGAQKYLVTAPMWNLGVPAVLKAYIDLIMQPGYTFRYTGPGMSEGLLNGRAMMVVSSRGGVYSLPVMEDYEMCVRFLRDIFGFMGIEVAGELVLEGLALVGGPQRRQLVEKLCQRARDAGREF